MKLEPVLSVEEAIEALTWVLASGKVRARGRLNDADEKQEIHPSEFLAGEMMVDPETAGFVLVLPGDKVWKDIDCKAQEVMDAFPPV